MTDTFTDRAAGAPPHPKGHDTGARRTLSMIIAVLTILTGFGAIAFPILSTLAVEMLVGCALVAAGIITTVHVIADRESDGIIANLAIGLLYLAGGLVLLANPVGGVLALTVLLGVTLTAEGILRIVMSFRMRPASRWGLVLMSGLLSVLLGLLVLAGLSTGASLVLLGTLFGINLIGAGAALMAMAWPTPDTRATAD